MLNKRKTRIIVLSLILLLTISVSIWLNYTLSHQKISIIFPDEAKIIISKIDNYIKSTADREGFLKNDWLAIAKGLNGKVMITSNGFFLEASNWFFFKNGNEIIGVCDNGNTVAVATLYKDSDWIIKNYFLVFRKSIEIPIAKKIKTNVDTSGKL